MKLYNTRMDLDKALSLLADDPSAPLDVASQGVTATAAGNHTSLPSELPHATPHAIMTSLSLGGAYRAANA